jgi:predicted nuclease of restriction endonuclease-like RecB superfamily
MLPTDLLIHRQAGTEIVPKYLPLTQSCLNLATEQITCFEESLGQTQGELDNKLSELEGDSPDYRVKRGLAHILKNNFSTFEIISPLEPQLLRKRTFATAAKALPVPQQRNPTLEVLASQLTKELNQEVLPDAILKGLYADLQENRILTQFDTPTPEALLHRYNLSQVQGIFYRASQIIINAHRNDPGEYKLLFRYLKLFQLMAYIEGDADHGFTISIDGPASLFKASTRYGLALAKMLPALLHVSKWSLKATLEKRDPYTKVRKKGTFAINDTCQLVSHYSKGETYDSMLEAAFAKRWDKLDTQWRLEREVELVPLPGSVMIPDFRLVHPDGRSYLLEIVGYWRPDYLKRKFSKVRRSDADNLILAISERLNLAKAGIKTTDVPAQVIWFKGKLSPKAVLDLITNNK